MTLLTTALSQLVILSLIAFLILAIGTLWLRLLASPAERLRAVQLTMFAVLAAWLLQAVSPWKVVQLPWEPGTIGTAATQPPVDSEQSGQPPTPASRPEVSWLPPAEW